MLIEIIFNVSLFYLLADISIKISDDKIPENFGA